MSAGKLSKVKADKAAEICQHFKLGEEAAPLLKDGLTPKEFLDALLTHKLYVVAIDFVAHALPAREAVWWGCLCARHAAGSSLPSKEEAAFKAAVQWVLDPNEENRSAAQAPAEKASLGTPAGGLAMAAFWSGGSMSLPN